MITKDHLLLGYKISFSYLNNHFCIYHNYLILSDFYFFVDSFHIQIFYPILFNLHYQYHSILFSSFFYLYDYSYFWILKSYSDIFFYFLLQSYQMNLNQTFHGHLSLLQLLITQIPIILIVVFPIFYLLPQKLK